MDDNNSVSVNEFEAAFNALAHLMEVRDRKNFLEHARSSPLLRSGFIKLVQLRHEIFSLTKPPRNIKTPTAKEVKAGHHTPIPYTIEGGGEQEVRQKAQRLDQITTYIDGLAIEMARWFPDPSRWHWLEIFLVIGKGGDGRIRQKRKRLDPAYVKEVVEGWYREMETKKSKGSNATLRDYLEKCAISSETTFKEYKERYQELWPDQWKVLSRKGHVSE